MRIPRATALVFTLVLACNTVSAGSGLLGLDHRVSYDNHGVWRRKNQDILMYRTIITVGAGAIWFGDNDRLGDTFWRSVDAMIWTS